VPARRLYVDTSAYLCTLLGEVGSERLVEEFTGAQLLSSVLLALEAERTLVHLSRTGRLAAGDLHDALDRLARDLEHFALRDLTGSLPLACRAHRVNAALARSRASPHGGLVPATATTDTGREPGHRPESGSPRTGATDLT
jgi:hypothetical protein